MTDELENDAPAEEAPMSTDDMLREMLASQAEQRAELASLRAELDDARRSQARPTPPSATALSAEDLAAQRQQEIADHDWYCPGCGRLYDRQRECTGRGEAPHPALEVVSTDELRGDDASKHTAAPGVAP